MTAKENNTRAERLRLTISNMIDADERISTRNIMKRMPLDFGYPNAITRPPQLRAIYEEGLVEQKRVREVANRNHSSRKSLEAKVLKQAAEILDLKSRVQVLTASHRAMYAAVGEMGGGRAWLKFFERHQHTLQMLERMNAILPPVISLQAIQSKDNVTPGDET